MCAHAYTHACIDIYIHIHTYNTQDLYIHTTHTHVCIHVRLSYMCPRTHTHTHTHTYTHTHTHHIYAHTLSYLRISDFPEIFICILIVHTYIILQKILFCEVMYVYFI